MLPFLVKSTACLAIFLVFYKLVLENESMHHLEHPEVYNKDIEIKEGKHGEDNEHWVFPSMINEDLVKQAYYNYQKIDVWVNDVKLDINKIK